MVGAYHAPLVDEIEAMVREKAKTLAEKRANEIVRVAQ